jgi:hypothetical protein
MLTRQEQILTHEVLTPSVTGLGTTYTSKTIPWGNEPGWILIIRNGSAVTGTTPGVVWELDVSDNGGAFTRVGGVIASLSTTVPQAIPYFTGTTQGAVVPSPAAGHTYVMQVKGVFGNADNVAADVTIDLVAMN